MYEPNNARLMGMVLMVMVFSMLMYYLY